MNYNKRYKMADVNKIGAGIGAILDPIIGKTTETTVTEKPSASSSTTTIVIVSVAVLGLVALGYFLLKKR